MDPTRPLAIYMKKEEHCQAFVADAGNLNNNSEYGTDNLQLE